MASMAFCVLPLDAMNHGSVNRFIDGSCVAQFAGPAYEKSIVPLRSIRSSLLCFPLRSCAE